MKPAAAKTLRDDFLAWQCRIRQIAMRQDGGRPSPGMRPRVRDAIGPRIVAGADRADRPARSRREHRLLPLPGAEDADPRDLYERALTYLQADYFQQPAEFGDVLTAVLPAEVRARSAPYSRRTMRAGVRRSSRNAIGCPARHSRPKPARRSERPRCGTIACSILRCPTTSWCWASGRIGSRPRPDRAPADWLMLDVRRECRLACATSRRSHSRSPPRQRPRRA